MTLHIQWMRFKRECLRGQTRDQIAASKAIFYAGASAATDKLVHLIPEATPERLAHRTVHGIDYRRIHFIVAELVKFRVKLAKTVGRS